MPGKSRNRRKRSYRARNSSNPGRKTAPQEEIPANENLAENAHAEEATIGQEQDAIPNESSKKVEEILDKLSHFKHITIDEELTPTEMASVLAAVQQISSSLDDINGTETTILLDISVPVDIEEISNAFQNVKISDEDDLPIDLTVAKKETADIADNLMEAKDDPSLVQMVDVKEEMVIVQENFVENMEILEEGGQDDLPIDLTVAKKEADDFAGGKDNPSFDKEQDSTSSELEFTIPDEYFEEEPDDASKKPVEADNASEKPAENEELPADIPEATTSAEETPATKAKKHVFRDPDSYQEFKPQKFMIQVDDSPSSDSSVAGHKAFPRLREHPPHSFLVTVDTVLMILECTLAGAYRISQQCTGPTVPMVVANTMQSVRLALETLKIHFSYTRQQTFEPLASILRELLFPAVELFAFICPEMTFPHVQFHRPDQGLRYNVPIPFEGACDFSMKPCRSSGMVFFPPHPIPIPKGPPRIALFMDNTRDPNLGAFATADGFIRIQLPSTFQIDLTIDGGICVRNFRDKVIACVSACGNYSALATAMVRVHQHNLVSDVRITDEFDAKNMFAKMGLRGIQFGGTGCPQNAHLRDDGTLSTTDSIFCDMNPHFIRDVFVNHSTNGPNQYEYCCDALKDCKTKTLTDGSLHFHWKDIKITQYSNGELIISRNHWNIMIWCAPEVSHIKKGVIKIVTPINRIVTTVINNPEVHKEKYFLANLAQMWVYYTARDYIVSNEVFSAGYNSENNPDDYLLDEAAGYQEQA